MARRARFGLLAVLVAALTLLAAACGGGGGDTGGGATTPPPETSAPETSAATDTGEAAGGGTSGEPIVIGAAVDLTGNMAPFDGPAIQAAKYEVQKINDAGGVAGRPLQLEIVDDQLDPEKTKQAAIDLIENKGAQVLLVTCDVDYATPAIQEAISRKILAVAPCIGTDQMGPKRFGDAGHYAFTLGNIAQDEGSAMAEYAYDKLGWRTAAIAKDNVIVYFQNVVDAFKARFEELGGKVTKVEEWTNGDKTIGNVASALAGEQVDGIATSTGFGDLTALVDGIRSLGSNTPIFCSWACDGTYWQPKNLSNFYVVTYASIAGDDPNPDVEALRQALAAINPQLVGTGGFVTGAAAIDAIAAAIEQTGATDGDSLANAFEQFNGLDTISGKITYSPDVHGVTGREYRVMKTENGKESFVELYAAKQVANLG